VFKVLDLLRDAGNLGVNMLLDLVQSYENNIRPQIG